MLKIKKVERQPGSPAMELAKKIKQEVTKKPLTIKELLFPEVQIKK